MQHWRLTPHLKTRSCTGFQNQSLRSVCCIRVPVLLVKNSIVLSNFSGLQSAGILANNLGLVSSVKCNDSQDA